MTASPQRMRAAIALMASLALAAAFSGCTERRRDGGGVDSSVTERDGATAFDGSSADAGGGADGGAVRDARVVRDASEPATYVLTEGSADCRDIRTWSTAWTPGLGTAQTTPDGFSFDFFDVPMEAFTIPAPELPDDRFFGAMQILGEDWFSRRDFSIEGAMIEPYNAPLYEGGLTRVLQAIDGDVLITQWSRAQVRLAAVTASVDFEIHMHPSGVVELHYCEGFDVVDADAAATTHIGIWSEGHRTEIVAVNGHEPLAGRAFIFTPSR